MRGGDALESQADRKASRRQKRRTQKMKVSGKSVFTLRQILTTPKKKRPQK